MKRYPDIDRALEIWMADGPAAIPDRVVDVVAARIAVNRQRRARPFPGRTNVTTQIKLIAGLAAALVVGVVGYSLLPGQNNPGAPTTAPSPTEQPTASPTVAPSVTAMFPPWFPDQAIRDANGVGIMPAGSQTTRVFDPGFTFSVPDGWVNFHDEVQYFDMFPDTPANAAQFARSDGELAQTIFMGPHSSPWFTCESLEANRGETAAEMVDAITANEVLAVSGLVDVTIGGLSGKRFDVQRNPEWTGTCPGDAGLPAGVDPEDERQRIILLDRPGRGVLVVFLYSISAEEMDPFLAEATPIVDSFKFDLKE
jgi:hypothetical protein